MPDQPPFSWDESQLPVPTATKTVLTKQWHELGAPGTWWTGEQRIAIAAVARAARRGGEGPGDAGSIDEVTQEAAAQVGAAAGDLVEADVDGYHERGLDPLPYVELIGIVSRVTAIDTATIGLGAELQPFGSPSPGEPSKSTVAGAKRRSGWVPTVGGAGATTALSAVTSEDVAQEQLHGALYLSYYEMGDLGIIKALNRTQMELAAARTSLHNDCYF